MNFEHEGKSALEPGDKDLNIFPFVINFIFEVHSKASDLLSFKQCSSMALKSQALIICFDFFTFSSIAHWSCSLEHGSFSFFHIFWTKIIMENSKAVTILILKSFLYSTLNFIQKISKNGSGLKGKQQDQCANEPES